MQYPSLYVTLNGTDEHREWKDGLRIMQDYETGVCSQENVSALLFFGVF